MNRKTYYKTVATVFLIIGIAHLVRAIQGWEAVVAGFEIPVWFSWAAVVIAGYLYVRGMELSKRA